MLTKIFGPMRKSGHTVSHIVQFRYIGSILQSSWNIEGDYSTGYQQRHITRWPVKNHISKGRALLLCINILISKKIKLINDKWKSSLQQKLQDKIYPY